MRYFDVNMKSAIISQSCKRLWSRWCLGFSQSWPLFWPQPRLKMIFGPHFRKSGDVLARTMGTIGFWKRTIWSPMWRIHRPRPPLTSIVQSSILQTRQHGALMELTTIRYLVSRTQTQADLKILGVFFGAVFHRTIEILIINKNFGGKIKKLENNWNFSKRDFF